MVRRDGAAIRSERIREMAKFIHSQLAERMERNPEAPYISLSKTMAHFQYAIGLRREKIVEYLRLLEELEHFTLDEKDDKIRSITES